MFSKLSTPLRSQFQSRPIEGELYKTLYIRGKRIDLFYGYYEDSDRYYSEPYVIYPDFLKSPVYTEDGFPLVTMMQEACEKFESLKNSDKDCSQCKYFLKFDELLGICINPSKQITNQYSQKEKIK